MMESKWYKRVEVYKIYLNAILDLYDRRIVSYVIRNWNDISLIYDTFDATVAVNSNAHPLFRSAQEFQYTNHIFAKLEQVGMTQNMFRIAHCIDNRFM